MTKYPSRCESRGIADAPVENRYVALLDILGWGHRIISDFSGTLRLYDELTQSARSVGQGVAPSVRFFSDSILVVAHECQSILTMANALSFVALSHDCLLRGGIAFGRHVELGAPGELTVLSEPLVHAAHLEKTVGVPCVAIHSSALPPNLRTQELAQVPVLYRSLLFFEGRWIVNPFNLMWYTSAGTRARLLRDQFPEHREKYQWFIGLHDAVGRGAKLVP